MMMKKMKEKKTKIKGRSKKGKSLLKNKAMTKMQRTMMI